MAESITILVIVLTLYTLIPTFLMRVFSLGAYPKENTEHGIALTFDDGPDPKYTPILLDLLARHGVKATFFVLGSKAERYPELILRMHNEGHLIGVHNYVHRTNALMMPWKVRKQINRTAEVIEKITGKSPQFYRPPWGVVNIFDFFLSRRFRIVLWSLIVGDWLNRTGKDKIKQRLFAQLQSGSVIVLHDSGDTLGADPDAPKLMIAALDEFLKETARRGFTFVRIDERFPLNEPEDRLPADRPKRKRWIAAVWLQWERFFQWLLHVRPIDPCNALLQFRLCRYHGKRIPLNDGQFIEPGDRVMELHLDNATLLDFGTKTRSTMQLAVQLIRAMERCLPHVSERLANDPTLHDVKGLYGVSIIHRGASQLGFTVSDLPKGIFLFCSKLYLRWLLYVIHPQGKRRLDTKTALLTPKMIAISVNEVRRRYPSSSFHNPELSPNPLTAGRGYDESMYQGM